MAARAQPATPLRREVLSGSKLACLKEIVARYHGDNGRIGRPGLPIAPPSPKFYTVAGERENRAWR